MFERFSGGYYLGRLYVEPFDGDRAAIQRVQHEQVNRELYTDGEGVERTDAPLVMKVENRHFPVHGDDGVPEDTLAIPESVFSDLDVDDPPSLQRVLLAKRDRAWQLLRLAGWRPNAGT